MALLQYAIHDVIACAYLFLNTYTLANISWSGSCFSAMMDTVIDGPLHQTTIVYVYECRLSCVSIINIATYSSSVRLCKSMMPRTVCVCNIGTAKSLSNMAVLVWTLLDCLLFNAGPCTVPDPGHYTRAKTVQGPAMKCRQSSSSE